MKNRAYQKTCQNCNEKFTAHRRDTKFCSTECKNEYHRDQNRELNELLSRFCKTIAKNRNILKNLYDKGHTTIQLQHLEQFGFNLVIRTHPAKYPETGKEAKCYLDYGLVKQDNGYYSIIKLNQKPF